jgi:hypothetical protein
MGRVMYKLQVCWVEPTPHAHLCDKCLELCACRKVCGICIVARTGLVLHRVSAQGLVQHYLFAYLKQANNTNMQRLFDMFVTLNCSCLQALLLLYRVCADLAAGCMQGFVEAHCKVAVCKVRILCTITTLYCFNAPGLRYRYGCLQACVLLMLKHGFVQHSLWHIQGFVQRVIHPCLQDDEHYNHVQPLLTQSCTASLTLNGLCEALGVCRCDCLQTSVLFLHAQGLCMT